MTPSPSPAESWALEVAEAVLYSMGLRNSKSCGIIARLILSIPHPAAVKAERLDKACADFRDVVLNQRAQLEAPCLDNDQTNAVLAAFDEALQPQPAPGQPPLINWSTLPEWAQWVAMDKDTKWFYFDGQPSPWCGRWTADQGTGRFEEFSAPPFPGNWRDSLQQRPTVATPEKDAEEYCQAIADIRAESSTPSATDTPTPDCDAAKWRGHCGDGDWQEVVSLHVAQAVERQRDYWKRHYEEKEKPALVLAQQLATLTQERDELRLLAETRWTLLQHDTETINSLRAQLESAKPLCEAAVHYDTAGTQYILDQLPESWSLQNESKVELLAAARAFAAKEPARP